ncbi:membrane protein [Caballeronia udeis]|uniref:Membrane protein n=1 Tax=Caballeronia udeis TaxID=1232866 RepID=A0A158IL10_9BURK|nr:DUF883 family protein [Caballeronia udeis]SAL57177.1 membrane protein [Caballeronia udeis]
MSDSYNAVNDVDKTLETGTLDSRKVRARLKHARKKVADAQVVVITRGRESAKLADSYVHERPWETAGVALGVGLLIGWLAGRK